MPYDEGLAQRIREVLDGDPRIVEKHMFGGIAFMANGNMAAGIVRDELMVRVGPEAYASAVALPHARAMDFTGRPMRGFVQVAPEGFEEDAELRAWLERGIAYAVTQEKSPKRAMAPAKPSASRAAAKPKPKARAKPPAKPRSRAPASRGAGKK